MGARFAQPAAQQQAEQGLPALPQAPTLAPTSPSSSMLSHLPGIPSITRKLSKQRLRRDSKDDTTAAAQNEARHGGDDGDGLTSTVASNSPPSSPPVEQDASNQQVIFGKPFLIRFDESAPDSVDSNDASAIPPFSPAEFTAAGRLNRIWTKIKSTTAMLTRDRQATLSNIMMMVPFSSSSPKRSSSPNNNSVNGSSGSEPQQRFWSADEQTRECAIADISFTSLLTFHGRNADAVNLRRRGSDATLIAVSNLNVVTIYANVGTGRYLTRQPDSLVPRFVSSPQEIRASSKIAQACEFLVRRAGGENAEEANPLRFGERIVLECIEEETATSEAATLYLTVVISNKQSVLSLTQDRKKATVFILHSPTLRELVQLNSGGNGAAESSPTSAPSLATNASSSSSVSSRRNNYQTYSNDFELAEFLQEQEREQIFLQAVAANLPLELTKRIFEYHADWVRTSRLVCKSWQFSAERKVRRIRVNGEFCSLETPEEKRQLVDFIRRCTNLQCLTLRNCHSLDDDDIAQILRSSSPGAEAVTAVSSADHPQQEDESRRPASSSSNCSTTSSSSSLDLDAASASSKDALAAAKAAMATSNSPPPNLTALILGGCRNLSDRSTQVIARSISGQITHLNLAVTSITDESLMIVAQEMDKLKELNLYNCSRVTVDGINRTTDIERGLVVLEHINLRGTVVDSHLVQEFKRKRPDVVVLTGPASADSIWG